MVERRRQALSIVLAVLASLAATAQALPQSAAALRLELTNETGGLRLVNSGAEPLMIRSAIAVEKEEGHDWVTIATEYRAVAQCGRQSSVDPVEIAPGATLTIVPWRGFSCSGQCDAVCRANVYYGPGAFRFIVTTLPGGQRSTSPTFLLPPRPEG
jgi:hypothetical protein